MSNIRTICIYHGNCADGFTAAWAARMALPKGTIFHPGHYGEAPPDVTGADLVLVDFSYKRDVLLEMAATTRSVLILDHHKSAAADLAGFAAPRTLFADHVHEATYHDGNDGPYIRAVFDMDRSGAQIAWDYFHGAQRPTLVDYVGDRDLWRFKLRYSRQVSAYIFSHNYSFDRWDLLAEQLGHGDDWNNVVFAGDAILRKHDKDVAALIDVTLRYMVIGGHRVPVCNLPYTMASDAAGTLAEGNPFAACYFDRADARVFSLRSRGDFDVSAIAAAYGGGGHRNAAGFQRPIGWEGDIDA
jgi:oligoribonuclease NrnB/cAMP/cGMP phosphodiesterase (DHH superfamily)